jgi:hypothetical protein
MVSSRPETGGFRGIGKRRELPPWPMYAQLRAGRQGRDQTGRTPCLPPRLPEWVPITFCDREPAAMVRRGAHPLSVGPRSVAVDSAAHLFFRAP